MFNDVFAARLKIQIGLNLSIPSICSKYFLIQIDTLLRKYRMHSYSFLCAFILVDCNIMIVTASYVTTLEVRIWDIIE